ncbi:two-component system, LuxR family, secretion system response regulator SsrB [Gemmobacter megaterium]|uniref:Two-component system, LuxR family, secretion system response regulator SsrB n=1 Tax=Gemmobacter megaterium TaxID=1086013 RepID=A0A1N7N725_9RHOB|nr:response regulator transcription factor [Gemmobacter megaterium]GGE13365.1 DNA-binding response regulator [Gemmobacter megaterium]SIS94058.1 two-component system, LuxR family, secretion system response regulator SsrB [Gemmobacter megaterium]
MPRIRVLLAEDHAFTLSGMQRSLADDPRFAVVATAVSGLAAIALGRMHEPDVALIDHGLPGANGLEVFIELRRWAPRTRCLIVTGNANPATLAQLHQAGLPGLMTKSTALAEVLAAITRVAAGQIVRSADVLAAIAPLADHGHDLSLREREVLAGIAEGLTNAGIATKLSISPKTVESHRASLMRKLDVNSTASLVVRAVRLGLLDL